VQIPKKSDGVASYEDRDQKSEVGGHRSEIGDQRSELDQWVIGEE